MGYTRKSPSAKFSKGEPPHKIRSRRETREEEKETLSGAKKEEKRRKSRSAFVLVRARGCSPSWRETDSRVAYAVSCGALFIA